MHSLDAVVWQDLCELLAHPQSVAYALERAQGGQWLPQELRARKEVLQKGQKSLGQQEERLTEAYLLGVIPVAEYQRRRRTLEQRQQALATQAQQLEAQADRQTEVAKLATAIHSFCQRDSNQEEYENERTEQMNPHLVFPFHAGTECTPANV